MKMGKYIIYNKRVVLVMLMTVLFAFSMQSQVTIGTLSPPLKGAILDLKEYDETAGNANSISGMMMARVLLTDEDNLFPMLSGTEANYEALKLRHAGLIVYNVNQTSPFEKGLYIWDGTVWNKVDDAQQSSISASNGLNISSNTVKLGGDLEENTTINLNNYNLNFNPNQGGIGVAVSDPKARLDIDYNDEESDPLILKEIKHISDANTIDAPGAIYYGLRASGNGVVRKAMPVVPNPNESFIYNLRSITDIDAGNSDGTGGSLLRWNKGTTTEVFIFLPEAGSYIFSFRLYGQIPTANNVASSYFISAYKNGALCYTEEFLIKGTLSTWTQATYSINIPVSGHAGDEITFRMGRKTSQISYWRLAASNVMRANRTTMVFWKL